MCGFKHFKNVNLKEKIVIGYIDAGTGSAIMAALAGGAAGLWVFVKSSMTSRFRRSRGDGPTGSDISKPDPTTTSE
jgi:hypothetical protein